MADLSISPHAQTQSLRDVNDDFESRKQDLKADHESKIRQMQKAYLKHEAEVRESGDAAINHIRKDMQKRIETEGGLMQENADQVLGRVNHENQQKIKVAQEQGIGTSESLKRQYSKDINRTHQLGEAELKETKDKYDRKLGSEESFFQGELDGEKKRFSEEQLKQQAQYENKRQEMADIHKKNIQELTKKFNEQFVKNDSQNKEVFTNQKQNFLKELYRQQQQLLNKSTALDNKRDDPFYQSRSLAAHLAENSNAYVLTAKIPNLEKNNFDVHVKNDKVVLESFRANEAKIEDGSEKSMTNTYQTYRQEFKFDVPVDEHLAVKQMDDQGNLTLTIPKRRPS